MREAGGYLTLRRIFSGNVRAADPVEIETVVGGIFSQLIADKSVVIASPRGSRRCSAPVIGTVVQPVDYQ